MREGTSERLTVQKTRKDSFDAHLPGGSLALSLGDFDGGSLHLWNLNRLVDDLKGKVR